MFDEYFVYDNLITALESWLIMTGALAIFFVSAGATLAVFGQVQWAVPFVLLGCMFAVLALPPVVSLSRLEY